MICDLKSPNHQSSNHEIVCARSSTGYPPAGEAGNIGFRLRGLS